MKKRAIIGFRMFVRDDGSYRRFTMEMREFFKRDALTEIAHHTGTPHENEVFLRYRKIREANGNGNGCYLEEAGLSDEVEIVWQGNGTQKNPDGEFYCPRIHGKFNPRSLALLSKVARAAMRSNTISFVDITPASLLGILRKLGAVRVEYLDKLYGVWLNVDDRTETEPTTLAALSIAGEGN